MDAGLISAIVMLIGWAAGTILLEPPGWFHALFTIGVFLLIMRIVAIGTKKPAGKPPDNNTG